MDLGFGDAIAVCLRDIKDSFSSFFWFLFQQVLTNSE